MVEAGSCSRFFQLHLSTQTGPFPSVPDCIAHALSPVIILALDPVLVLCPVSALHTVPDFLSWFSFRFFSTNLIIKSCTSLWFPRELKWYLAYEVANTLIAVYETTVRIYKFWHCLNTIIFHFLGPRYCYFFHG